MVEVCCDEVEPLGYLKVKVKCTLVQALRLFNPGKDPVPIVQEAGWAPGPVWTGVENLVPTRIQSPDRPARSQSLYQLSYPAHFGLHG